MPYKVLVVDDSSFFRRRVTDILNKDSELIVIDVAVNGQEAVDKAIALKPDVITMDIEMPVLNGIEAVKQIMAQAPTAILMFSSITHQGAKSTLEALDAGALDFLPKKFNEIAANTEDAGSLLRQRVIQLCHKKSSLRSSTRTLMPAGLSKNSLLQSRAMSQNGQHQEKRAVLARTLSNNSVNKVKLPAEVFKRSSGKDYKLLAIGTSTGGPVALQKILTQLPKNFPLPIIIVQHMPAAFTKAFAERLNLLCQITVKEASDGDILKPGCAYLAPGGRQMIVNGQDTLAKIKIIDDNSPRIAFKPSVDVSFGSAAKVYSGSVLAVILTGMGTDGLEGSRMLKNKGSTIWSQNEETCVVYGMPQAVSVAGISEFSLPIENFTSSILKEIQHG
jgi:two-component system chemotaxis response regulator CheB